MLQKQIEKINRAEALASSAFWLERHEKEFAPKEKGATIVDQVAVGAGIQA